MYEYAFIGGGPSSLTAAFIISAAIPGQVAIFEAGNGFDDRGCPGLKRTQCVLCDETSCPVTMGFGGASAGFGNKLCHFPASSALTSKLSENILRGAHSEVERILGNALDVWSAGDGPSVHTSSGRKFYTAETYFRREYRALIDNLISSLPDTADVHTRSPVDDVSRAGNGFFELRLGADRLVRAKHVVFGAGRSGHEFLRRTWRALGVPFRENAVDIGIRLEASNDLFDGGFFYQNDPKYKFKHGNVGSSRTFCSCKDGLIVPVRFGAASYADGAFANRGTGRTNVALMVRSSATTSLRAIEDWCSNLNAKTRGSLLLAELEFCSASDLCRDIIEVVDMWPTENHRALMSALLDNVVGGKFVRLFRDGHHGKVKVYGPAVDLYWPRPLLTPALRSPTPGVSVIGDATGVSRGILQSMASGAAWGLMERERLSKGRTAWQAGR